MREVKNFEDAKEACKDFVKDYPTTLCGPAHLVVATFNLENWCINSCLEEVNRIGMDFDYGAYGYGEARQTPRTIMETHDFLHQLLRVPEDVRLLGKIT